MSVHDGQRISELLYDNGLTKASSPAQADVLVLTTCSVREKARQKVYSAIGRMKQHKARRPTQLIVVAGCVAQQDGQELLDQFPHVDVVLGSDQIYRVAPIVDRVRETGERVCLIGFDEEAPFLPLGAKVREEVSAYVTVQKGCDEGCAYCIVPTVRGPARCRDPLEVVDEVSRLVERGVREIVLLGQTVNAYHASGVGFAELLKRVSEVEGVWRIRYESAHPRFLDASLVEAHASIPSLCEHLHLPVQAGSDDVLRRMGRGHDQGEFLSWLESLRSRVPGVGVSTDLFVGFPGESDADFERTLALVREARFDGAYSFKYSPRPGTLAARWEDDVPQPVKVERLKKLQEAQGAITASYLEGLIGSTLEVLVEGESKVGGQLRGRSRRNAVVNIELPERASSAPVAFGQLVDVKVTHAGAHSVRGVVAHQSEYAA